MTLDAVLARIDATLPEAPIRPIAPPPPIGWWGICNPWVLTPHPAPLPAIRWWWLMAVRATSTCCFTVTTTCNLLIRCLCGTAIRLIRRSRTPRTAK